MGLANINLAALVPTHTAVATLNLSNRRRGLVNVRLGERQAGSPSRGVGGTSGFAHRPRMAEAPVVLPPGARHRRDQFAQVGEVAQVQHLAG